MRIQSRNIQGTDMCPIRENFILTNFNRDKTVAVCALVDTGTSEIIVTPHVAKELGFDLEEVSSTRVILADGRRVEVPRLRGVEIHFGDRSYTSEALVLDGDECLVGCFALGGMDLIVDPKRDKVVPNPAHPDGPCFRV